MKKFKNYKLKNKNYKNGMIIVQTMVFAAIAVMIISALASFTATSIRAARISYNREQAFQSAEAGIDYYRWHLAHASTDYQDGTGTTGTYVHSLKDKDGNTIGQFSLNITAPTSGSTLVKIKSTGSSSFDPTQLRKILAQVAKPSVAEHAFAGNSALRFGAGTEVFGSIHSNGGIRFDGLAHNIVTSGVATYTDTDSDACTSNSYGVHTCIATRDPSPNGTLSAHSDVFAAGRKMSQPVIDFSGFVNDIADLKTMAQTSNGFYRDVAGTGFVGYHIVLKTNDTFDLYKINSWIALPSSCTIDSTANPSGSTWSINAQTLQGNYPFPTNGIIFIQDHLVIDGQINGARLTITAALLPEPTDVTKFKNIIINNDLSYTNYDGTDSIGLVAQGGVMVGMISDDNLKIDGALMAQHNIVGRFYYVGSGCTISGTDYSKRSIISLYGMIASYGRYGFAYTNGTGYNTRTINYDANLLYAPPPEFPLTSDQYQILSWQEVKN